MSSEDSLCVRGSNRSSGLVASALDHWANPYLKPFAILELIFLTRVLF